MKKNATILTIACFAQICDWNLSLVATENPSPPRPRTHGNHDPRSSPQPSPTNPASESKALAVIGEDQWPLIVRSYEALRLAFPAQGPVHEV